MTADPIAPSIEMRMIDARHAGREVATNRGRRVNPWRHDGDTAQERVLSIMWAEGHSERSLGARAARMSSAVRSGCTRRVLAWGPRIWAADAVLETWLRGRHRR